MKTILPIISIFISLLFTSDIFSQAPDYAWAVSASGTGFEHTYDIAVDHHGNVFACGAFTSTETFFGTTAVPGNELNAVFIAKYDQMGTLQWVKTSTSTGEAWAYSLDIDSLSNVFVTGIYQYASLFFDTIELPIQGGSDAFLVKLDTDGNILWANGYGGINDDYGFSVAVTPDGDGYLGGHYNSPSIAFDEESLTNDDQDLHWDMYVARFNTNGDIDWARTAEGPLDEYNASIAVLDDGSCVVVGQYWSHALQVSTVLLENTNPLDNSDSYVIKYDSDGEVAWARGMGGSANDLFRGVVVDDDGNNYITGYFFSNDFIFNNEALVYSGSADIMYCKLDSDGASVWAIAVGSSDFDRGSGIDADDEGNVYITGYFAGFTLTLGTTTLTNNNPGEDVVFVTKVNAQGEAQWASSCGPQGIADGTSACVDANQNVYIAGYFQSPEISFGDHTLNNGGLTDGFVTKLGDILFSVRNKNTSETLQVFPNPFSTSTRIQLQSSFPNATIILRDLNSRIIREFQITSSSMLLNRDELKSGIYFLSVAKDGVEGVGVKVVVE